MKNKLLFLDTETGGLVKGVSLLTAYLATYDDDFNLLGELDLKLIPDDGVYHVEGRAVSEINKIDLRELYKTAIPYKKAGTMIYEYLDKMYKMNGDLILSPIGHNVKFDIVLIVDQLISKGSWDKYVSYRTLDTCSIARFLQYCGKLPEDLSCGLSNLKDYFNINVDGEMHTAKTDVLACVEVFKKLSELNR